MSSESRLKICPKRNETRKAASAIEHTWDSRYFGFTIFSPDFPRQALRIFHLFSQFVGFYEQAEVFVQYTFFPIYFKNRSVILHNY